MGSNDGDNRLRHSFALKHVNTVSRVRGQNCGRYAGVSSVVGIVAHLVFFEVTGALELADIVIIRADAGQKAVCADFAGSGLGQVGNEDGVVIGAGRFQKQSSEQRLVGI